MSQSTSSLEARSLVLSPRPASKPFCVAARVFQRRVRETELNHSVSVRVTVGNGYCDAVMVTQSPCFNSTRPLPSKAQ